VIRQYHSPNYYNPHLNPNLDSSTEGNGKYLAKDRCRFFDTANGSALECAAGLDILMAKRRLTLEQVRPGKESLQRIVRMLMGLI
jgi:four helix bundle protein